MIALIQRVNSCKVYIENQGDSVIQQGLLVFLGIEQNDSVDDIKYCAKKIINLRIFDDNQGKMNLSVKDLDAEVMIISQFTLCGNTKKGNRPSYVAAMDVESAKIIYNQFLDYIVTLYKRVQSGTFQAPMNVALENNGPVNLIIRSNN